VVALKVPAGTRSGKRLRLRGQGLAGGQGGRGDCIARIELDLPEELSARQRELLDELGRVSAAGAGGAA
jgi:curved DNA-binding protein